MTDDYGTILLQINDKSFNALFPNHVRGTDDFLLKEKLESRFTECGLGLYLDDVDSAGHNGVWCSWSGSQKGWSEETTEALLRLASEMKATEVNSIVQGDWAEDWTDSLWRFNHAESKWELVRRLVRMELLEGGFAYRLARIPEEELDIGDKVALEMILSRHHGDLF